MPLSPGVRLGPYEIHSQLGAGGMGEVWRARDTRLDRDVAIKVLPPALASDPDRLVRFEREAKALAALNHPGILAIHGFEHHASGTFAVTELLEGRTLRDRLAQGLLPLDRTLTAAAEIADALAAAHGKGIVHRDLKPENLWVLADGRLKILDFGLARLVSAGGAAGGAPAATRTLTTEVGAIVGTPGYMAPEQVRGEPADARSDLFAFGLVLYEMLTGQLPFRGATAVQTLHAVLDLETPPLVGPRGPLPPALQRLVLHCLEKAPEARFQDARDLAFALRGLLVEGGVGSAVHAARPSRRGLALGLGALLLAAGLGAGFLLPRHQDAAAPMHFAALTPMEELTAAARFCPDGRTVLVGQSSAPWREPTTFQIAIDDPTRRRLLLDHPAGLAGLSAKDELAVLDRPGFLNGWFHYFRGNLAVGRLGQSEPRLVAEDIAGMDWSPDGATMAVLHCLSPRGMAVECPPGKVLATTEGWFSSLRFSPDGRRLAWAMHPLREDDGGTAFVCDVVGGTPHAVGETWSRINGVAFHPHSGELWVGGSDAYTGEIAAYDRSGTKRTVYSLPYVVFLHDIDANGRVLLGQGDIEVGCATVEADGHAAALGGRFVQLMAASRDGTWYLLGDVGTWRDYRCDVHLQQIGRQLPTILGRGLISCCGAFSPDDKTAAFLANDDAGLVVRQFPVAGGKSHDLPLAPLTEVLGLAYDGRGRLWALGHRGEEPLAIFQVEAGTAPRPLATALPAGALAFSIPPGSTDAIVVVRDQPLHALPLDGGPARALPFGLGSVVPSPFPMENGDRFLGWEDGGAALFVSRDTRPPVRVERIALATGARTPAVTFQSPDTGWGAPCFVTTAGRRLLAVTPRFNQQLFLVEGLR